MNPILHCSPTYRLPLFILVFIVAFSPVGIAQSPFAPAPQDQGRLKQLSDTYQKLYKEELAALPSKNKKDYEEIYKQRWDNIKAKFDKEEVYTSVPAQQWLDAFLKEIVSANPLLKDRTINCYFSRSGVPNASYIGEGIILFNMGLFKRLANENEAAFVLCHEISHYWLRHNENNIEKYVSTINSDEVQKELHKINKEEYGKRAQVEKLLKGLTFSTRRHSRDHESQADSMAVEFMHNTRFDVSGALTALALLDSIDAENLNTEACLRKLFDAKAYPFQKKWIAKEEGLLGGHAKLKEDTQLADSLKTHPDCQQRIKLVEPMVNRYKRPAGSGSVMDDAKFADLKNAFQYEIIEYAFTARNYTQSFYYTISLLEQKQADPYLVAQVGRILNGLYDAQKAHTLGRVVDLPAPDYPSGYNLLLQFVQNLYLEDIASISYQYLNQYSPGMDGYAPFKTAYAASAKLVHQ